MRDNVCIFQKILHDQSGEELETSYLDNGVYVESMELDGPRLLLTFRDPEQNIKNMIQPKGTDTLTVSMADSWRDGGESFHDNFTILTIRSPGNRVKFELMATKVYSTKQIADRTRIFKQRAPYEVIQAFSSDAAVIAGQFPVIENYHCIAGERPSTLLRQIAKEHGAHIWYERGKVYFQKFADLFKRDAEIELSHGNMNAENIIISYNKPSGQIQAQEENSRSFTGWDEKDRRVKTDSARLGSAKSTPPSQTASPYPLILGNQPVAKKFVIDLTAYGNLSLTAGQSVKLSWRTPAPQNPLNEGLPDKIIIDQVAHWYSSQKFMTRIKGAAAYEPL